MSQESSIARTRRISQNDEAESAAYCAVEGFAALETLRSEIASQGSTHKSQASRARRAMFMSAMVGGALAAGALSAGSKDPQQANHIRAAITQVLEKATQRSDENAVGPATQSAGLKL